MYKWQRFRYLPVIPIGEDGRKITGCKAHTQLSRTAATEGMVLLKNEQDLLPLKPNSTVALFGKASADYVKGGGGSGDVNTAYIHNLCYGMLEKQSEGKIKVYKPLVDFYEDNVKSQYQDGKIPGQTVEPQIDKKLLDESAANCDVAIISICRYSCESHDRTGVVDDGDFYLTKEEREMVEAVTEKFDNVVIVLNVGGMVDTLGFRNNPKIKSILLAWQAGLEGGLAEADILCGDVCPSGKLTDTFASSFDDYPSSYNFNESRDYVEYTDDIFVGYRYFETIPNAFEKVNYPFGYGLSYTKFDISNIETNVADGKIKISSLVTNVGKMAGKEVLQEYISAPKGKLDKPKYELKAFAKTSLLDINESTTVFLEFDIDTMASYDESIAAFVLEAGDYDVYLGTSVRDTQKVYTYSVKEFTVTEQLHNRCVPRKLTKRLRADGTYQTLETSEYDDVYDTSDWPEKPQWKFDHIQGDPRGVAIPEGRIMLDDVVDGKATLDEFVAQLSINDLIDLVGGRPNISVANTLGFGDLSTFGVPAIMTVDGPAGVRINKECSVPTTAWPCATLLACTWNTELVEQVGKAGALEVKENNLGVWLTPGLNIHRSPLCGRNFEYYSEDPFVSGKMAVAMVKGIQSENIGASVKHFCCNNKEVNRKFSDSRVSERALREIYLKGFEIVVKEAEPMTLMSAYNIINGKYASENSELLINILREEWEFKGLITSDWNNCAEHYRELKAGNNVRMPTGSGRRILKALELGLITREEIEKSAKIVLQLVCKFA